MKIIVMSSLFALLFLGSVQAQQAFKKPEEVNTAALKGTRLPEAILIDQNKEKINLYELIRQKPTVLVIYRGGWCPYCNSQLAGLAKIEEEILAKGFQIIAVSPDNPENLSRPVEKNELNYLLLSDEKGAFIKALGLAFETPFAAKQYIGLHSKGKPSKVLPVPAVLLVNSLGEILFQHADPDYKKRMSTEELLRVLEETAASDK